jgi:hypothetical protein
MVKSIVMKSEYLPEARMKDKENQIVKRKTEL